MTGPGRDPFGRLPSVALRIQAVLLLSALIAWGCSGSDAPATDASGLGLAPFPEDYPQQIEAWQASRRTALTEPNGWMRLAGMHWLQEGEQTFGSGPNADVIFPEGTLPASAGVFQLAGGTVTMRAAPGVVFTHDGGEVREIELFRRQGDPSHGSANGEVKVGYGTLDWIVIQRGDRLGIRLYNRENPVADRFTGFERYPLSAEWRKQARLIPPAPGETVNITNILGQVEALPSTGRLVFNHEGETHSLVTIGYEDDLFVIVGDRTNGGATYGAGRYLDIPKTTIDRDGMTVLDFNRLYNPPCSYSAFSTCQLPPVENRLDLLIEAGEKLPREDQLP